METNVNMDLESLRHKLVRLASISPEAIGRIDKAVDAEIEKVHAASMGVQSFSGLESAELEEAAGRAGLTAVSLKDSIARAAAEKRADVVLGKLDSSELLMLRVLCGDDRVQQAERITALRATGKVGR